MERITTAEAARRLGISLTAVRRRVDAGTLCGEWEPRPQGRRLVILWDATQDTPLDANLHTNGGHPDANTDANPDATVHVNLHVTPDATRGQPDANPTLQVDDRVDLLARIRWLEERLEASEESQRRGDEAQAELRRLLLNEQQRVAELTAALRPMLSAPYTRDATQEATRGQPNPNHHATMDANQDATGGQHEASRTPTHAPSGLWARLRRMIGG